MAEPIVGAVAAPVEHRESESLEFPGCRPVRITCDEIDDCEDYFEYWDADTEVAMVCEPVSYYHERPVYRLAQLADRIAAVRGAPIEAVGHTDLLVRNTRGERRYCSCSQRGPYPMATTSRWARTRCRTWCWR